MDVRTSSADRALVLVVDDEEMIRWSVEETLHAAGYDVVVAATVADGLSLLRRVRPAVVFLDLHLPDASGLTVLQCVKDQCGSKTAVIVMTAHEEICTAAEAQRLGAFGYLKKPFDFDRLAVIAAKAVEGNRSAGQHSS